MVSGKSTQWEQHHEIQGPQVPTVVTIIFTLKLVREAEQQVR